MSAQLDALNKAISDEDVAVKDLTDVISKVVVDMTTLKTAVAAGGKTEDITAQITAIQAHLPPLLAGTKQLKDSDVEANA